MTSRVYFRALVGLGLALATAGEASVRTDEQAEAAVAAWPVRGQLAGEVKLEALAGLGLTWQAEAVPGGLALRARRPGVECELEVKPEAGGAWSWRVRRGEIDLAEAWPLARGWLGGEAAGWSASGTVQLEGAGRWTTTGGLTGKAGLILREGWARSDEMELELGGIELDVVTTDLAVEALPAGQILRVARLAKSETEARNLRLEFGVTKNGVVEVASGTANLLGGEVRLKPFAVALDNPVVDAVADVDALQLSQLAGLMPWLLDEALGRLRGRVQVAWDETKGVRLRDGGLEIVASDEAEFRLAPSPGLLTGDMPEFFGLLPANWRWARWVGFKNPAYAPLREIELGRQGLRLETFRVTFWPDGPGGARTASIQIVGRPTGGQLVEEVKLDLNLHGPLTEALAFGLNQDFGGIDFRMEDETEGEAQQVSEEQKGEVEREAPAQKARLRKSR